MQGADGATMGFSEARAVYIRGAGALYRNTGLLNKAVNTLPRHSIYGCALHLHARRLYDPSAPELTLTRLQRRASELGGLSPGRVAAHVMLLRKLGFLEARQADDRRQRILVPTDKMIGEDHRWLMSQLEPLRELELFELSDEERSDIGFALSFRASWAVTPAEVRSFVDHHPTFAFFVTRDGGYSMLLELLQQWLDTGSTEVSFDAAATASAFCVSKSQIWSLLQAAQAKGLLEAAAPAWKQIQLTERLLTDFDNWFAEKAAGLAVAARRSRAFLADRREK